MHLSPYRRPHRIFQPRDKTETRCYQWDFRSETWEWIADGHALATSVRTCCKNDQLPLAKPCPQSLVRGRADRESERGREAYTISFWPVRQETKKFRETSTLSFLFIYSIFAAPGLFLRGPHVETVTAEVLFIYNAGKINVERIPRTDTAGN